MRGSLIGVDGFARVEDCADVRAKRIALMFGHSKQEPTDFEPCRRFE
jgi:hypothetical protein